MNRVFKRISEGLGETPRGGAMGAVGAVGAVGGVRAVGGMGEKLGGGEWGE